eukprot:SAG11_NODE_135_length_15131_cov_9.906599_12_plen_33_part_01
MLNLRDFLAQHYRRDLFAADAGHAVILHLSTAF